MHPALLWVAAFAITCAENAIGAQETRAVSKLKSKEAAHWSLLFEVVLVLDVVLIVNAGWALLIPIGAGAWLGTYISVEQKKRRMLAKKREKARLAALEDHDTERRVAGPSVEEEDDD